MLAGIAKIAEPITHAKIKLAGSIMPNAIQVRKHLIVSTS
jgi:hypothetical protein